MELKRKIGLASGLIVALVSIEWYWSNHQLTQPLKAQEERVLASSQVSQASSTNRLPLMSTIAEQTAVTPAEVDALASILSSDALVGTQVDGFLELTENNQLRLTMGIRRLFDYFYVTLGDVPQSQIAAAIRGYVQTNLPEPARSELLGIYQKYQTLLDTLDATSFDEDRAISEQDALDQVHDVRIQVLGKELAEALYGESYTYDQYALSVRDILASEMLSYESKQYEIARLQSALPESRKLSLERQQQFYQLHQAAQSGSLSQQALYQERQAAYGDDAARRLSALDEQRQQWQARISQWLALREQLMQDHQLDEHDRRDVIDQHRADYFKRHEWLRVQSAERIHDASRNPS